MFCKPIVFFLLISSVFFFSKYTHAQLIIENQGATAEVVVNSIISGGLTISNATINCPTNAYGTFTNGATTDLGIPTGLVLTTGNVGDLNAPGNAFMSTDNGANCNDPQLNSLEPLANNDCCILEFDVVPTCDELQIRFVFGSEEYPEWVSSGYNDALGFFISGQDPTGGTYVNSNVALLPDGNTIVSIDNVNAGLNAGFYVDNSAGLTNIFDAFTRQLLSVAPKSAGDNGQEIIHALADVLCQVIGDPGPLPSFTSDGNAAEESDAILRWIFICRIRSRTFKRVGSCFILNRRKFFESIRF